MAGRKPSSRHHRLRPIEGLNLTPFIDMITCLMFFLLMFAALIPVAIIDAPLPKIAATADEVRKAKDTDNRPEVIVYIEPTGFRVRTGVDLAKSFPIESGKYAYPALHKYLVQVHSKMTDQKEITLVPSDNTNYEVMVEVMDVARELLRDDPGYRPVPPEIAQKPESLQFNRLFPDVNIGGV